MYGEGRAREVARTLAGFPEVAAIALGGSVSSGVADAGSDIDVYVFTRSPVTTVLFERLAELARGTSRADLGLPYWGGVNEWIDPDTGVTIDCTLFGADWMEEQVARVLDRHEPSLGYSTAFCRTIFQAQPLYDRAGWFEALQARTKKPYPEPLRHNIVAFNYPVLRDVIPSYRHQIESAVRRDDGVSVNHRVAALLASYFDILFALNRVYHPGEKRLLVFARRECEHLPEHLEADVRALLAAAGSVTLDVVEHLHRLINRLDTLLQLIQFFPAPGS